ncbi:MAG: ABC transporter permease subunit [Butyrivibrio sp.]|nr:ABC transporter permease subunit [Butyrivibrio sp.]
MKQSVKSTILPIAAWLIIWQLVAVIIHNKILLAGPIETISALVSLSQTPSFWQSVSESTGRILTGFFAGTVLGILAAYLAYKKSAVGHFLKPLVITLKSVPVASFVILLLIWFGSRGISVPIVAMVVFPILYLNTLEGLKSTDTKLLEMAGVFRMPMTRQLRYIFFPQLLPFLKGAVKLAIGMSFKSGIAAEVIGQPMNTIGNGIYQAKIYLETGELFAWTIVVVLISFICEKLCMLLLDLLGGKFRPSRISNKGKAVGA